MNIEDNMQNANEPVPVAQSFARYLWGYNQPVGYTVTTTDGTAYIIVADPVGITETRCLRLEASAVTAAVEPASKPTTAAFTHAIRAPKHQIIGLFTRP